MRSKIKSTDEMNMQQINSPNHIRPWTTRCLIVVLALFMWQCKKDDFKGETTSICPEVLSVNPKNGDTSVIINKRITVVFNKAMNPETINERTFLVKQGATPISGKITTSGDTAIFVAASYFAPNTVYTGTITSGSMDPEGNALPVDYVWSFKTGRISSQDQPRVVSTDPADTQLGVEVNRKITVTFSKEMDPATISGSFIVKQETTPITGTITYSGLTATFVPSVTMLPNTYYTGAITEGARDLAGNTLIKSYYWTFRTGAVADTVRPVVVLTDPVNGASNVPLSKVVTTHFSKSMDPATINSLTYTLKQGVTNVPGTVSHNGKIAVYTPAVNLAPGLVYTATIMGGANGARDLAGNTLAANYTWSFTTGNVINQQIVDLKSAGNFAILAGSGVTNTGLTIINGDVGTSPTGTITGFLPGIVNGTVHAADPIAAQAKLDLTAAYNDAKGRTTGAVNLAGDLSGLTLTPGLYVNASAVQLSAGNVILDALGDANAVFIINIGSTLTTSPGTMVILSGGAQAKNIFWSVGSSATLGTTSVFNGNILAAQSISLNTGATLNGRALAQIGAVTLITNVITKP